MKVSSTASPPQKKVLANYLIENLIEAAFLNADEMAKKVDTTPSSVVRFAKEIGFRGFPDLQSCLRKLLIKKVNTVGQFHHAKKIRVKGGSEALSASFIKDIESINKLNDMRRDADIIEFVKILLNSKKKYIVASRSIYSSEISLFCPHESSSFFTSHVASMALVNGIISEFFAQNYNAAKKNLEIEESLLLKLNILGTKGRIPRKSWRG